MTHEGRCRGEACLARHRGIARRSERGFALILVFLMAGVVALLLYREYPRIAFETEREKEQLLTDRGQQYVRAITLYYTQNRKFPTDISDMEDHEKRTLRRRYIDPYTGKDEWRLIHGNGTTLTDSLVQTASTSTGATGQLTSGTPLDGQPTVNAAVLERPSDYRPAVQPGGQIGGVPGVSFVSGAQNNQGQNAPLPPITLTPPGGATNPQQGNNAFPPITIAPAGAPPNGTAPNRTNPNGVGNGFNNTNANGAIGTNGVQGNPNFPPITLMPGQAVPGFVAAGNPQFPGQAANGGLPGGVVAGQPGGFRIDANGLPVPVNPVNGANGQQPGVSATPNTGIPSETNNAALGLINQILTTPRAPVAQNTPVTTATNANNTVGVGIVGVASTHTGPSIAVYNDQQSYELWEFVWTQTTGVPTGVPNGQNNQGQNQNSFQNQNQNQFNNQGKQNQTKGR